jgi:hypothetical protein
MTQESVGDVDVPGTPYIHVILRALEGHAIRKGAQQWVARVLGLHVDAQGEWVQIQLEGPTLASLVLLLRQSATKARALAALDRYDPTSPTSPHLIEA